MPERVPDPVNEANTTPAEEDISVQDDSPQGTRYPPKEARHGISKARVESWVATGAALVPPGAIPRVPMANNASSHEDRRRSRSVVHDVVYSRETRMNIGQRTSCVVSRVPQTRSSSSATNATGSCPRSLRNRWVPLQLRMKASI